VSTIPRTSPSSRASDSHHVWQPSTGKQTMGAGGGGLCGGAGGFGEGGGEGGEGRASQAHEAR